MKLLRCMNFRQLYMEIYYGNLLVGDKSAQPMKSVAQAPVCNAFRRLVPNFQDHIGEGKGNELKGDIIHMVPDCGTTIRLYIF
jgi:hypothetical protein